MNFIEYYLNEMFVIGTPKDGSYVIAFSKWIYVFDGEDKPNEEILLDILKKLKLDKRDEFDNFVYNFEFEDITSFITSVQEYVGDILCGNINGKDLYISDSGNFKFDPKSSILVKKVVNQLKLKSVTYVEDLESTETKVSKKKMLGQIPDIGYHGTSSEYLTSILSKGLKSDEAESNYSRYGIHHSGLIFFATRIGEAMHHAQTTTSVVKSGIPIILEFKIPDKDQIIADYDVEKMTDKDIYYGDTGERGKYQTKSFQQDPNKLSKHFGVYGYKQRIPASFIKFVWVATKPIDDIYSISDFKKMKPKTALNRIEMGYYEF